MSLGTTWGLFRYYWVVLKLGITAFATVILLIYMGTFRQMAGVAADPVVDLAPFGTLLRSFMPSWRCPVGRRNSAGRLQAIWNDRLWRAQARGAATPGLGAYANKCWDSARNDTASTPAWVYVVGAVALALAVLVVILHLTGASPTHH